MALSMQPQLKQHVFRHCLARSTTSNAGRPHAHMRAAGLTMAGGIGLTSLRETRCRDCRLPRQPSLPAAGWAGHGGAVESQGLERLNGRCSLHVTGFGRPIMAPAGAEAVAAVCLQQSFKRSPPQQHGRSSLYRCSRDSGQSSAAAHSSVSPRRLLQASALLGMPPPPWFSTTNSFREARWRRPCHSVMPARRRGRAASRSAGGRGGRCTHKGSSRSS